MDFDQAWVLVYARKGSDNMNLHDYLNVRRVLKMLGRQWKCPVWVVKLTIQRCLDETWANAQGDPEATELLNKYFPEGKPSPEGYILRLGRAHETGENVPYLLK